MTSRGAANVLTRTTSVLAALFFATSLTLAITSGGAEKETDIIEELTGEKAQDPNAPVTTEDLLNTLGTGANAPAGAASEPAAPILEATPEPATGSPPATEPSGAPSDSPASAAEPAAGTTEPQP
jgi:preprotein translocase subunit SecG